MRQHHYMCTTAVCSHVLPRPPKCARPLPCKHGVHKDPKAPHVNGCIISLFLEDLGEEGRGGRGGMASEGGVQPSPRAGEGRKGKGHFKEDTCLHTQINNSEHSRSQSSNL